jgi:hypothetical protein
MRFWVQFDVDQAEYVQSMNLQQMRLEFYSYIDYKHPPKRDNLYGGIKVCPTGRIEEPQGMVEIIAEAIENVF